MAVDLLAFSVLGDVLGFLGAAFAGWRYLFSASYRSRVHTRWHSKSQLQVAQDIAAAVAGSVLWLVLFWLAIGIFAGFDWISRLFHGTSSV
jgi:H+/Cl- antiporter ClcA